MKHVEDIFEAATKWITKIYDPRRAPEDCILNAVHSIMADPVFACKNLRQVIHDSGFSQKHFICLFKKYVGLTPKYFQRIMRLNEILPKIQNSDTISWTRICYECGYFDQAHFIKEFKHFSGYNPREFLDVPLSDERTNFFPIDHR